MAETTEEYRNRINQLKTGIENEPYIKKMRENIAEGVSKTGNRQADIEEQFQEVIDNTTGKDVISAPELIAARNGETNLKARLDKEQQKIAAQLAETEYVKVGGGIKAQLEDFSPEVLAAIEGGAGTNFNLTTIPQDYSVSPIKTDFLTSNQMFIVGRSEGGKALNDDTGILLSLSNWATSDYIPLKSGDTLYPSKGFQRRLLYTVDKQPIIGSYKADDVNKQLDNVSAEQDGYIRLSYINNPSVSGYINPQTFKLLKNSADETLSFTKKIIQENTVRVSSWNGKNAINFGTSISWQDGKAYTQSSEIGKIARGYQTHLREKLGLNINNQGVSGSRIVGSDGTRMLAETFDFKPYDLVIFEIGTNDFKLNTPLGVLGQMGDTNFDTATFIGAYRHLIEYVLTSNPNIKIVLFTPLQRDNGGYDVNTVNEAGHKLIDYVNAIRALEEMYSLRLVDMYKNSGFNKFTLLTYTMDGLHPNDIGYEEMGGLAVKEIDQINI